MKPYSPGSGQRNQLSWVKVGRLELFATKSFHRLRKRKFQLRIPFECPFNPPAEGGWRTHMEESGQLGLICGREFIDGSID